MNRHLEPFEQESLALIAQRVSQGFGVTLEDIRGLNANSRFGRVREARAVVCWLADKTTTLSSGAVGHYLQAGHKTLADWSGEIEAKASAAPAYQAMLLSMAPPDYARRRRAIAIIHNAENASRLIKRAFEEELADFERRLVQCLGHDAALTLAALRGALDGILPQQPDSQAQDHPKPAMSA